MNASPIAPGNPRLTSRRRASPTTVATAVAPVGEALLDDARRHAATASAAAEHDAEAELARARDEASAILDEARADGARAAAQRADAEVAAAHREARGVVLAARREAYLTVRRRALEALAQRGGTPEGRRLGDLLEALARERVGPTPTVRRSGPGDLDVVAASGNRRAAIGPAELVDRSLRVLADQVATLWA